MQAQCAQYLVSLIRVYVLSWLWSVGCPVNLLHQGFRVFVGCLGAVVPVFVGCVGEVVQVLVGCVGGVVQIFVGCVGAVSCCVIMAMFFAVAMLN